MSAAGLSEEEQAELYLLLKPREGGLAAPLVALLRGIENSLYGRLTIEQMEALRARLGSGR